MTNKKNNNLVKKSKDPVKDLRVEVPVKVDIKTVLSLAIDDLGIKSVVNMICQLCFIKSFQKCSFPSPTFIEDSDVDNVDTMMLLTYILDQKEELIPKAKSHWSEKISH